MSNNIKTVCSFDPGVKNFSFLIEEYDMDIIKGLVCPPKTKRFVKKIVSDEEPPARKKNGELKKPKKKKRGEDLEISPEYNEFLEEFYHCSRTLFHKNTDVSVGAKITSNKCLNQEIFTELTRLLDDHKEHFDSCQEIVIEEQMSFGARLNLTAIKIAQHVYSYFIIKYGNTKKITIIPAYNKTQLLGCPGGLDKPKRKKWIVEKVKEIWTLRGDLENVEKFSKNKKYDDIADTLGLNMTYMILENF
jgi:hypothetical protein